DYRDFYENLYVPYVTQRFGPAAFVVDPTSFYQECRRGVLLRLTHEKRVVGAALLRPIGRTLAVVWSALDVLGDGGALRGVTDSLDYFSLLYAHMTGCRWLDLGPSRPDLCDGILRYKSKWGAEITQGLVPQANIMWACKQKPNGDLDYFRRHAFLTKTKNGLQALMVIDGRSDLDVFLARLNTGLSSGIRNYRVIALQGIDARLKERTELLDANLALLDASDFPDFTSAFTSLA